MRSRARNYSAQKPHQKRTDRFKKRDKWMGDHWHEAPKYPEKTGDMLRDASNCIKEMYRYGFCRECNRRPYYLFSGGWPRL